MNAEVRGTDRTEKPGRLELAIREWQRQLVRRREAQLLGQAKSGEEAAE